MSLLRAAAAVGLCLLIIHAADGAQLSTVPVVTRLSGMVTLNSAQTGARDLESTELLNESTVVVTDGNGAASIELAGTGAVRIGPSAQLTANMANGKLYVQPQSGMACIRAQREQIVIRIAGYDVVPQTPAVVETAADDRSAEFMVVAGGAEVSGGSTHSYAARGHAFVIVNANGFMHAAPPMPTTIASWRCSPQ